MDGSNCFLYTLKSPPTGVMAEAVGAHGVHVTWEQPTDRICRIGFSVSFTPERGGHTLFTGVGPSASEYTVQNLLCNTVYVFTVGSVARGDGSVSLSEGVRVLVGGNYSYYCLFTIAYQSVSVTLDDRNSIIISWTIVECIEQNGPITHYVVQ